MIKEPLLNATNHDISSIPNQYQYYDLSNYTGLLGIQLLGFIKSLVLYSALASFLQPPIQYLLFLYSISRKALFSITSFNQ